MDKLFDEYKRLPLNDKREVLLLEMQEVLKVIESICKKKKISINKLKSKEYIKDKQKLMDEDYFDLLFIYLTYIKEDLSELL
jgi:hypothetical protein